MRELLKTLVTLWAYIFHHNHDSKVIYYHDAGRDYTDMGTDLDLMDKHFALARKSGYTFVDNISERKGQLQVCFDDGWRGLYDHKDFFMEHGIRPTVFIAVSLIDKEGYMTQKQISELQDLGFHFEGHTWSHIGLTNLSDNQLKHELQDSKARLEELFEHPFDAICFPLGFFNERVISASQDAGYKKLYSSVNGGYYDLESRCLINRNLMQSASAIRFYFAINGRSKLFANKNIQHQHRV